MEERLEQELQKIAPIFLRDMYGDAAKTCMAWGCSCGDGWFSILKDTCSKIEEINSHLETGKVVAGQIKEKFGVLTIYVDFEGDVPFSQISKAHEILEKAEEKSWKTCERCGKPAEVTTQGWITRLCQTCFNLKRKGLE